MAVGLFNWNSDDTYFQFNEVYDIQIGGTEAYNDGQGIEIDALNDRTWVQYNYVHDNRGGFMMFCTIGDAIRGYDYVVRYNISQNDYAHPRQGVFDIYTDSHNAQVYNNTMYLTERALKGNQIFLFATAQSPGANATKFYNNIFYYDGATPAAATQFGDNAIDWQSNIFYGFTNLPENDNPSAPNLSVDPMLVDPGKGGTGSWNNGTITKVDLSCYKLLEGSPAINAGMPLDDNGGRDYFGNEVKGIPDIGAYESGSVVLKLLSNNKDVVVDEDAKTITINAAAKVTAALLLESLVYEDGVVVAANRDKMALTGGIRLAEDDVVKASFGGKTLTFKVKVAEGAADDSNIIPADRTNATAGSQEISQSNDAATNVLDGNVGTIWHTAWSGAAAADRYLTLEVKDGYEYEISGYVYTPRTGSSSGAVNGIITEYAIYVSDDNSTWEEVASGTWAQDSAVKTVSFAPVTAKYVKLLAVKSVGNFASAAEARLIGTLSDTQNPKAPVLSAETITDSSVVLQWLKSTDNIGVVDYVLLMNNKEVAVFDADTTSYEVTGLTEGKEYTFALYAVDGAGNKSNKSSVKVTIESPVVEDVTEIYTDVAAGKWYVDAVQYVYDNGLMSGSNGLFNPTADITRAQIVTTLYRLAGEPAVTDKAAVSEFSDVAEGKYYTDAVCWAYANGIATGNDGKFDPTGKLTRQQMAAFFFRYAQYAGLDTSAKGDISSMLNADKVSSYAKEPVEWAVGAGLISGSEVTVNGVAVKDLNPRGNTTRAQVATILMRFCAE